MTLTYTEINTAYLEVMNYLSDLYGERVNLDDKIAEDLDFWGNDNDYLLCDFVDRYALRHDGFNYKDHFESEDELYTPLTMALSPFIIVGWLSWKIIERAIPGLPLPACLEKLESKTNPRKDLTVGDLIAWRLAGNFCLRAEADIRSC